MINRRQILLGTGAALVIAPTFGGFLRELFTGSKLKKMTWYKVWEAWDEKQNSIPLLAEGDAIPSYPGLTPVRSVYVFRTNRKREVAQVLRWNSTPTKKVTYESPSNKDEALRKFVVKLVG